MSSAMCEFKDCVAAIEVVDATGTGLHYTWNQKPKGGSGILKKLDRIMGNIDFIDTFPGAYAIFQPYRISDHSPMVLKHPTFTSPKPKPFKFFNFLAFKTKFTEVSTDVVISMVHEVTNDEIKTTMFIIGDDRAPGPDGLLLKEINHTFLALIPKVSTPRRVNDYRPISCCNVIYKCISKILTNRTIKGIKEVVSDNQSAFIPDLSLISIPALNVLQPDLRQLRDRNGNFCPFSVAKAWDTIRPHRNKNEAMGCQWQSELRCALCDNMPDSHSHLFFECTFSAKVWSYVRDLAGMDLVPSVLQDILLHLQPMENKRMARRVFVWLKLISLHFKNTAMVRPLLERWKMPNNFRLLEIDVFSHE
nr:RNA-directed DNA polymerase, eukaryota, reverse transcriptase zinc-binding domain protein [Tanacetum cinerariifolium]